jgi:hypothetical protein
MKTEKHARKIELNDELNQLRWGGGTKWYNSDQPNTIIVDQQIGWGYNIKFFQNILKNEQAFKNYKFIQVRYGSENINGEICAFKQCIRISRTSSLQLDLDSVLYPPKELSNYELNELSRLWNRLDEGKLPFDMYYFRLQCLLGGHYVKLSNEVIEGVTYDKINIINITNLPHTQYNEYNVSELN